MHECGCVNFSAYSKFITFYCHFCEGEKRREEGRGERTGERRRGGGRREIVVEGGKEEGKEEGKDEMKKMMK